MLPLDTSLVQGERYRIKVNGLVTATFTPPGPDLGYTHLGESLVQDFEIEEVAGEPGHYHLGVASGRPSGSCTRFNGYEVIRREPHGIGVKITHHQVSDPNVMCTNDFPIDETLVLLGSAFEAGVEYTVTVNGQARTFSP